MLRSVVIAAAACLLALSPSGAWGETLASFQDGNSRLVLTTVAGEIGMGYELRLSGAEIKVEQVFDLENPPRVVIDLAKPRFGQNHLLKIAAAPLSGLRTGVHPARTRIVLDFSGKVPAYHHTLSAEGLVLKLSPAETAPGPAPTPPPAALNERGSDTPRRLTDASPQSTVEVTRTPTPTPTPTPTHAPIPAPSPASPVKLPEDVPTERHPGAAPSASPTPSAKPAVQPVRVTAVTRDKAPPSSPNPIMKATKGTAALGAHRQKPEAAGGPQLDSIEFTYEEPSRLPVLKLSLTTRSKFTFSQVNGKEYVLTIADGALRGSHLALPYFPPHDFKGFRMILTRQEDSLLKILVTVDQGTHLTALPVGTAIVVKEATGR